MKIKKIMEVFNKKTWNGFSRGYKTGIHAGMITTSLSILLIMFMLYIVFHQTMFNTISTFYNNDFSNLADKWQNDIVIGEISHLCNLSDSDILKVKCVVNFACNSFKYVDHNVLFNNIKSSPEAILTEGGVCRDYAIFYMSIFNNLNIENEFNIPTEHHINNRLFVDNRSYIVDNCMFYEEIK